MANKSKKKTNAKVKVASSKMRPSSSKKEANIAKEGKSFRVRVSIDGKRVSKSFKTQSQAIKYRDKAKEKQSKVIRVTKVTSLPKSQKKTITKKALKKGEVKVINPKTGRKVRASPIEGIDQVPLTKEQAKKAKKDESFFHRILDGKVVPLAILFSEEVGGGVQVRFSGQVVQCDIDQLSELVNLFSSEYYQYAKDNETGSPTLKYYLFIDPEDKSVTLNLDETFVVDDPDNQFDKSFVFFNWLGEI